MSSKSTIFNSQLTVVDHAYIDQAGNVVGGSFNPDFIVTGDVDPIENVVVDFSTIKKDIKRIVDANEDGFDHKLWIIKGFSQASYETYFDEKENQNRVIVTTPTTLLDMPSNALKVFAAENHSCEAIGKAIGEWVEHHLKKLYPSVTVRCLANLINHLPAIPFEYPLDADGQPVRTREIDAANSALNFGIFKHRAAYFTYVHGLKESTSFGCKSLAHGHLSYVTAFPVTPENAVALNQLLAKIAQDLDGNTFIRRDNIVFNDENRIIIDYETTRGRFVAQYNLSVKHRILDTETTIEFLADMVRDDYLQEFKDLGIKEVFVSEGLTKGAISYL